LLRRKSLLWQIFPPFLVVSLLTLLLVTGFASRAMRRFHVDRTAADLTVRAHLFDAQIGSLVAAGDYEAANDRSGVLGVQTDTRITVILPNGRVVCDSDEDPALMDNHADRPEIRTALRGETGRATRYSATLQHTRLYVAVPGGAASRIAADEDEEDDPGGTALAPPPFVMRASLSLEAVDAALHRVYRQLALVSLVLAGLAALVSYAVARRISVPLRRLQSAANQFAQGDLDVRLTAPDTEEIGALADTLNAMAAQLADRIGTIEKQRNEYEAVLGSMTEGVIAVDQHDTILGVNRAGARLLGLDAETAVGRTIQEIVRNPGLLELVAKARGGGQTVEGDVAIEGEQEIYVQAHATSLKDPDGKSLGALIVLNDVTRLRRLETMRRDFVANVSHELRTPITSIAGFVETLQENPPDDEGEFARFLDIVGTQAARLKAIIADLLSLSRIEQEADNADLELGEADLEDLIRAAVAAATADDESRAARVTVACPADLRIAANTPLLEQALVNLVDNALKYSEPATPVAVTVGQDDGEVSIAVEDHGRGIAAEHLPRLVERFYRVDKARSRKLGGTGLGLAIVKHIVQAHGGEIKVTSTPGEGSTFTIVLPQCRSVTNR
jgi:two-component system phosphate regulon sensor histidine kinase PhoR